MTTDELHQLRCFLDTEPEIKQTGRYTFDMDDGKVDFSPVTPLPPVPEGLIALWGKFVGWLGDRYFILRMYKILHLEKLRKRRSD